MDDKIWQHQTFYNSANTSENILDFNVYDLTDVNLGRFVIGIQTTLDFQKFGSIKNIIREGVERFAVIAKPLTVSEGLEKLYAYINKHGRDILQPNDYRQLHVAIIYITNGEMHFSVQGNLKLMLIRKNNLFDIIKMTYGLSPHNYDKLFGRMYSGSVKIEDSILVTSNETWDCFDTQKIPDIVTRLSVDGAVGFFSNYLPEHSPYKLGGLLINMSQTEKEHASVLKHELSPVDSLNELISTEEKTSEWISPTPKQKIITTIETARHVISKYISIFNKIKKYLTKHRKNKLQPIQHQRVTTPRPEVKAKPIKQKLTPKKLYFTNLKNKITSIKDIPKTFAYFFDRAKRLYSKWPKSTKYLLITAIVLVIALTQSVSYTQKRNHQKEQTNFFNQQTQDIRQEQTQANQAIIFKDFSRARTILINTSNKIATLPSQTEDQQAEKQELQTINQQLLDRANRQTLITNPNIIANINTSSQSPITDISLINNSLFVLTSNELISINPGSNPVTIPLDSTLKSISAVTVESPTTPESELIVMYDDTRISSVNTKTGAVTTLNLTINHSGTVGASMYTNRLYALNKNSEQIIRYRKGSASFQAGQNWLDIPVDLSNAKDIAVDGSVYVLDGKEGIMQFNKGARTAWRSEKLEPPITTATKLVTSEESDYLYVLDPNHQRFLIFTKDGEFVQQFTSPSFTNLIDIAIQEKENNTTAFLLNGKSIVQVDFKLK